MSIQTQAGDGVSTLSSVYEGKLAQCLRFHNCQAASNSLIKCMFWDKDVPGTVFYSWGPEDEKMPPLSSQGPTDQCGRQVSEQVTAV